MAAALQLVVGLGNPGRKYAETRHNAGFRFVDRLADSARREFRAESRFHGQVALLDSGVRVLKPSTYMNESGRAVRAALDYFGTPVEELLVVYDEIDLPPGTIRLKHGGGHGGHNGLRDIVECLGQGGFTRLRIGVGHPGHKDLVISYVLNRADAGEQAQIDDAIGRGLDVMPLLLAGELQKATQQLHSEQSDKP